jgi:hypothetical protein
MSDQILASAVETLIGGTADTFVVCAGAGLPVAQKTASEVRTLLSVSTTAQIAAAYQPLDSDLTAIAALTTTSFGRALLTQADASATRSTIGLGAASSPSFTGLTISGTATGSTPLPGDNTTKFATTAFVVAGFQPLDSDLTAIAALTTTSFGRALLALADAAALRTAAAVGTMSTKSTYQIKVALSGYDAALSTGTKKGYFDISIPGVITGFSVCCDPANEPSAAAAQFDLNTVDASTGALTSVLTGVASIATSANVSTGGAISGSPAVAAGDKLAVDCDQGSDGKYYVATITITAT